MKIILISSAIVISSFLPGCSKPQTEEKLVIDLTPSSPEVLATAFRRAISVQDAENKNLRSPKPGAMPVTFGMNHDRWEEFKANLQPDDVLIEFYTPPACVGFHHGFGGFEIVRQGKTVATFISST